MSEAGQESQEVSIHVWQSLSCLFRAVMKAVVSLVVCVKAGSSDI